MEGCPLVRCGMHRASHQTEQQKRTEEQQRQEQQRERPAPPPQRVRVKVLGLGLSGGGMAVGFVEKEAPAPACDASVACYLSEHSLFVRGKRILQLSFGAQSCFAAVAAWHHGATEAVVATPSRRTKSLAAKSLRASHCFGHALRNCSVGDVESCLAQRFDVCLALDVLQEVGDCSDALVSTLRDALGRPRDHLNRREGQSLSAREERQRHGTPFAVVAWTKRNDGRERRLFEALASNFDLTLLEDVPAVDRLTLLDPDAALRDGRAVPLPEDISCCGAGKVCFRVEPVGAAAARINIHSSCLSEEDPSSASVRRTRSLF